MFILQAIVQIPNANAKYTVEFVIDKSNVSPSLSGIILTISNCSNGDPNIFPVIFLCLQI